MAKQEHAAKKPRRRARTSLLTKVLLLVLLAGAGWQLYTLQGQVAHAQETRDRLAQEVAAKQQENESLSADIAQGNSKEKMEEIARNELGLVTPGEYVFYDVSN